MLHSNIQDCCENDCTWQYSAVELSSLCSLDTLSGLSLYKAGLDYRGSHRSDNHVCLHLRWKAAADCEEEKCPHQVHIDTGLRNTALADDTSRYADSHTVARQVCDDHTPCSNFAPRADLDGPQYTDSRTQKHPMACITVVVDSA